MPSAPTRRACSASSTLSTPLMTSGPFQRRRMASMWRQLRWSRAEKSRITLDDMMGAPRVANEFSKCGMPWRSSVRRKVPATQPGRTMPSQARRRLGLSGVEKPVRMLFSRLAEIGMSTVTTRVRKPARSTRSISASMRAWSPGI